MSSNLRPKSTKKTSKRDEIDIQRTSVSTSVSTKQLSSQQMFEKLIGFIKNAEWALLETWLRKLEFGVDLQINNIDSESGLSPLIWTVKEGRMQISERLIELGANLNQVLSNGMTALHYAVQTAKEELVRGLLKRNADSTVITNKFQLPLHLACGKENTPTTIIEMLLRSSGKDARIFKDSEGLLPLHYAINSCNYHVCKELLQSHTIEQLTARILKNKDTALHLACRRRNVDIIRLLVENGSEVDDTNIDGHTPLHISSWEGDEDAVKYFYTCKANSGITDEMDRTPLHLAAERGKNKVIELLIDKFKCNYSLRTKDGSTLMHIASESGHQNTALLLLKKGVPLHMPNKAGAICLHSACRKGHVEVVNLLLQKGAQIDARTKDNYTPLHVAVENGKYLVVQMLLGYGADVQIKGGILKETPLHISAKIQNSEKCAEMLLKSGADPDEPDENGETALHIACRYGQIKLAKIFLEDGANATAVSKSGETSLHIAVRCIQFEIAKEILEYVETNLSRLDAVMLVNTANFEGETVVHYACEINKKMIKREFEDTDFIKLLLKYGGDISYNTKWTQETALHYCAASGNMDIFFEIKRKFDHDKLQNVINQQAKNGSSPLLVASEKGNVDVIRLLLTCNARTDIFDENGKSALHLASEYGQLDVVNLLLDKKAFINAKTKNGFTALHLACQNGHSSLVQLLIDRGADVDAITLLKKTSLHLAAEYGQLSICTLLIKTVAHHLLDAVDNKGQTAFHLAAENDHVRIIKIFLRNISQSDLITNSYDQAGNTCAHIAASKGSVEVLRELIKFSKASVISSRNKKSQSTCLHLATAGGFEDAVKLLLEAGANPIEENLEGMTPINLAAKVGNSEILNGLKKFMPLNSSSKMTGLTALHIAAFYGKADFCREMLEHVPANIISEIPANNQSLHELKLEAGLTPLHLAAFSGHEGVIRLLLNSPNVEVEVASAKTDSIPLHFAAENGHIIAVGLLLSKLTSQLHTKNKFGRTAIHLAATFGHTEMITVLIGQGANINVTDKTGWTALHYASLKGHLNVVRLLVESGCPTTCQTNDGKVPICFAAANGHNDVLDYLLTKNFDAYSLLLDNKFLVDLVECGKVNENVSLKKFILLSPAPVEIAVKLSSNYLALSEKEKSIAKDLVAASKFCQNLANELVTIVASFKNIESLLKAVDNQGSTFIDILINCEQKEVLSNFVIQQSFSDIWDSNLKMGSLKMISIFILFLLPPIWILFSLPIPIRFKKNGLILNRVPIIKFLCFLVSHIYLVALLYLTCVQPMKPISSMNASLPEYHEWLLLAWFSGLLVAELSHPSDKGGLGFLKIISIISGTLGWVLHVVTFGLSEGEQIRYELFYGRNILFGFVLLVCCIQLLDFLSFHASFGPWAIIFREILKDVFIFVGIFILVLLGFSCLFTAAYQDVYPDPDNKADPSWKDPRSLGLNIFASLEFMFFSIFGITDPSDLPTISRSPIQALAIEKTVYCVYVLATMTILLNLLVAMMSTTYQRIQQQSDIEWKFGRAKLIRNMAKTSANPPSPLNIPTKLIKVFIGIIKFRARFNSEMVAFIDEEETVEEQDPQRKDSFQKSTTNTKKRESKDSQDGFIGKSEASAFKIESIVDWKKIVKHYLKTRESNDTNNKENDEEDDNENEQT